MAEKDYSKEIDALKNDVKLMRDDLGALVSALGEDIEHRGDAIRAAAESRFRNARARGEATLDQVEQTIERNPLTALATALGIGFLIGALMGRR